MRLPTPFSSSRRGAPVRLAALLTATLFATSVGGCGGDTDDDKKTDTAGGADASGADGTGGDAGATLPATDPAPDCDPLQPTVCSLPWPSSRFLKDDAGTDTGKRLALGKTTLPANWIGVHVLPDHLNRFDGYGVGSGILVHFPNLDASGIPDETAIADSQKADAKIALLDLGPVKAPFAKPVALPWWAELDGTEAKPEKQGLFIRPAVILEEAHRYVVALRGLKDTSGAEIASSPAFAALRDGKAAGTFLEPRVAGFDEVFAAVTAAGWKREELVLAWDFVTASDKSLHGDLLDVRDQMMQTVGSLGAELTITSVETFTEEQDPNMAMWIKGEFTVPEFREPFKVVERLGDESPGDATGYRLRRDANGKPKHEGTRKAEFWAVVPHSAMDGTPHGIVQYGHGLLGKGDQVKSGYHRKVANDHKLIYFACDWTGMAEPDEAAVQFMIFEFSDFYMIPEGLHQGMAEALALGRGMRERFTELPQIKAKKIQIDKKRFYYTGISQGGIYGGTYMALSQDVTRGHLGVPGQNYSVLLHRSVDFNPFFAAMIAAYGNSIDRGILLLSAQTLWDPVDPSSHYRHIEKAPYPNTPAHQVLLASAKGDWQVALITNEITARSDVGVALMENYGKEVAGVTPVKYPHKGSALVNYDFGNPWPKPGNRPDDTKLDGQQCGPGAMCFATALCDPKGTYATCTVEDPHSKPRRLDHHNEQMVHFLDTGEVKDVCGGDACTPF
ncbi:MAG: hypothetical protein H6747_04000 [Deltaproteobacteria bacterium]|nr:hypothetical protein [Deltaproteobacteria bacterium]